MKILYAPESIKDLQRLKVFIEAKTLKQQKRRLMP